MKKLYAIVLALLVALFCAACGGTETESPENVETTEPVETVTIETEVSEPEAEEEPSSNEEEDVDSSETTNETGNEASAEPENTSDNNSGEKRSNVDGMNGSGDFDIDTPCEICGGSPSQMFTSYTDGMPDEPAFYCEPCTLTCFFCGGEATTHYNKGLWGEIFTCQDCYDGVHGE